MQIERMIVGLGNPGEEYAGTRHNVGFWVVSLLARQHQIPLKYHRHHSRFGTGTVAGVPVLLAQPMTYMNRSGEAVHALLKAYHLSPEQMLVVYDDVALPLGTLRLRSSGSAGGHNGVQSSIHAIQTEQFPRLRVGVGPVPNEVDMTNFVLSPFEPHEKPLMHALLAIATEVCAAWLTEPIEKVMARYNRAYRLEDLPSN